MLPTTKKMDMHHPTISSSKAPAPVAFCFKDDAASAAAPAVGQLKKGKPDHLKKEEKAAVVAEAAVDVCLAAAAMAGAALLTWWAVAFHPSYAQLWMVPLGLVLACTPPVVCLALRFSGDGAGGSSRVPPPPGKGEPPLAAVVVHK